MCADNRVFSMLLSTLIVLTLNLMRITHTHTKHTQKHTNTHTHTVHTYSTNQVNTESQSLQTLFKNRKPETETLKQGREEARVLPLSFVYFVRFV